jgi:SH3 domain protein
MNKIFLCSLSATLFTMILFSPASWAGKPFITGSRGADLRSGPTTQNRVTAMIPPGTEVDVSRTHNEWSRVRYVDANGDAKEGWVLSRFLEDARAKELAAENASLKDRMTELDSEKTRLSQREKELTDKLNQLQKNFDTLKAGSANYLKLKEAYDSLQSNMAATQENMQKLAQENENLKISQGIKWFAAGAAVLVAGWLFGWLMGRQRTKRRTSYFL